VKLEFFLSLRYFVTKKRRSSISLISLISIGCVALAVLVLIVVFSVLNGFHQDMKSKILSKESHIVLTGHAARTINNYNKVTKKLTGIKGIVSALPFYEGQGLLRSKNSVRGVKVRGVVKDLLKKDRDFNTKFKLISGKFDLTRRNNIVIGEMLSQLSGISVGDLVNLYVPPSKGGEDFLLPLNMQYRVAGVFSSGFSEYDEYFVFMSLPDAQFLFGVKDVAYGIGVKLHDFNLANYYKRKIDRTTGYRYTTRTWMSMRRNLYQALITEKTLIGVVLFFIIIMAAFAIASTLTMIVMEKEREIGILKSVGMTPSAISRVFIIQGFIIGMVGTLIGLVAGLLLATSMDSVLRLLESGVNFFTRTYYDFFHGVFNLPYPHPWKLFPPDVYYVSAFPVKINVIEVFAISLGSVLLTTLCAFIPARQASKLKVAEVLHKE